MGAGVRVSAKRPVRALLPHRPAEAPIFCSACTGLDGLPLAEVVSAFDLSRFRRFVDLGGGTGHLAMAMADQYPDMKPPCSTCRPAVEFAREFVDARVELMGGDFFRGPLPPADLYGLGRILHDWSEEKIRVLLAEDLRSAAARRRAADCGNPVERRKDGTDRRAHAVTQHAGVHGGTGTQSEGIR